MADARDPSRLRKDLRASTIDGAAYSVNVGIGETYLPAFLLAVGGGEILAGLVASVPLVAGALLQSISPLGVRKVGSLRGWVILCATVQSFSFLPLIFMSITGADTIWLAFLSAAVYWASALGAGPAWNTWMGTIVPRELRARFFSRRSRIAQVAVLLGLVLGGSLLEIGKDAGIHIRIFAITFLIAACARFVSTLFLRAQSEIQALPPDFRIVSPWELVSRLRRGGDARLLIYMLAVTLTVQVVGPYFTPFMLGEMHFSYVQYMTLVGTSYMAKILMLPALGRLAHRFGAKRLLWLGGIGIVPLSSFWILADSFEKLLVVQLVAGCMWAAYELSTFLLTFEHIREEERTSVLTLYNVANALLTASGAILGGLLLSTLGTDHAAYITLFAVSASARCLTLLLLFRVAPMPIKALPLFIRTLALRPSAGSIDAPIVGGMPTQSEESETTIGSP